MSSPTPLSFSSSFSGPSISFQQVAIKPEDEKAGEVGKERFSESAVSNSPAPSDPASPANRSFGKTLSESAFCVSIRGALLFSSPSGVSGNSPGFSPFRSISPTAGAAAASGPTLEVSLEGELTPEKIKKLTPEQMQALKPRDIKALTEEGVAELLRRLRELRNSSESESNFLTSETLQALGALKDKQKNASRTQAAASTATTRVGCAITREFKAFTSDFETYLRMYGVKPADSKTLDFDYIPSLFKKDQAALDGNTLFVVEHIIASSFKELSEDQRVLYRQITKGREGLIKLFEALKSSPDAALLIRHLNTAAVESFLDPSYSCLKNKSLMQNSRTLISDFINEVKESPMCNHAIAERGRLILNGLKKAITEDS